MDTPEIFLFLVPATAFVIGFVCSQAGVSGAFLILPFQMSILGFVGPSVNATNFLYNTMAIPGGVYRYWREGRLLIPLAAVMIAGYLPGIYAGTVIRTTYLAEPKTFKLFVGIVLFYIGIRLLWSSLRPEKRVQEFDEKLRSHRFVKGKVRIKDYNLRKITFEFWNERYSFSPILIFLTALTIGTISGAYGVGGGSLMSPLLVTFFHLPVHTIAGATLLGTFTSSVIGVVSYTSLGYPPDIRLGVLLGAGGLAGIYAGARFQKFMPETRIRTVLSILVLALAVKYILQYWI